MENQDFFRCNTPIPQEGGYRAEMELVVSHPIFAGHFPGQPVLPGACMVQMVKAVVEQICGRPLLLHKASSIKFLVMVDPFIMPHLSMVLRLNFQPASMEVLASLSHSETIVFKFKGAFLVVDPYK